MNRNMEKILGNQWVELIIRWFLGLLFIYASIHKIIDPAQFAKIIYGYKLFPEFSINLIAIILPFLELVSGIALITGIYPRSAASIVNLMLFAFIIAISINLVRGHEFDCGCFTINAKRYSSSAGQLLFRDTIYFILSLHLFFFKENRRFCLS